MCLGSEIRRPVFAILIKDRKNRVEASPAKHYSGVGFIKKVRRN
jgi:hypothetical protein